MRTLLLLALALAACASPQDPGTILDWAPVRPPPVPGVGLPKPRAPTFTPAAKPQPQPKPARLLPQTPETARQPGIWATNAPPWRDTDPVAFGIRLPFLGDELSKFQETVHRETVQRCAFIIRGVGAREVIGIDLMKLHERERACFVARMNEHCGDADKAQVERFETYGPPLSDAFRDAIRQTRALAAGFALTECRDGETDAVTRAVAAAKAEWERFSRRNNANH